MKSIMKDTMIITVITLIAGILLGAVYMITKDPIARQEELAKQEACAEVFAEADSFESLGETDPELQAYVSGECGYDGCAESSYPAIWGRRLGETGFLHVAGRNRSGRKRGSEPDQFGGQRRREYALLGSRY